MYMFLGRPLSQKVANVEERPESDAVFRNQIRERFLSFAVCVVRSLCETASHFSAPIFICLRANLTLIGADYIMCTYM